MSFIICSFSSPDVRSARIALGILANEIRLTFISARSKDKFSSYFFAKQTIYL